MEQTNDGTLMVKNVFNKAVGSILPVQGCLWEIILQIVFLNNTDESSIYC